MAPSVEPEPTVNGALPMRTTVEVNVPIVDRPGVPADLHDTYWWTEYGDAGQVGTTAQIGLPADERILTVASGLVVSARKSASGDFSRADLFVRDVRTGALVREIVSTVGDPVAAVIGSRLFWAGVDPSSNGEDRVIDGGVWSMLLTGASEPEAIVPPGDNISTLGSAGRSRFRVSPSEGTIASVVGGFSGRFTDIVDVGTLTLRTRLLDDAVFALTDEVALVSDHPPADVGGGGVIAKDIDTGSVLWRFPTPMVGPPFGIDQVEARGSRFVVLFLREAQGLDELVIGTLQAQTGKLTERLVLRPGDQLRGSFALWSISSSRFLALIRDGPESAILEARPISLLDLDSGTLEPDAFVLDTPWRCYPDYCLRD